jgi:hypothetical protein
MLEYIVNYLSLRDAYDIYYVTYFDVLYFSYFTEAKFMPYYIVLKQYRVSWRSLCMLQNKDIYYMYLNILFWK